jgi:hypothetical protein
MRTTRLTYTWAVVCTGVLTLLGPDGSCCSLIKAKITAWQVPLLLATRKSSMTGINFGVRDTGIDIPVKARLED